MTAGWRPVGDRAVLVEAASQAEVHRMWRAWRQAPGVQYAMPGARTVLVVATSPLADRAAFVDGLAAPPAVERAPVRTVEIPVVYDGPDLDRVAALTGLPATEVADRHASAVYTVGFLGFSPGFAYISGGDPRLDVGRLAEPRPSVPAGSVAIAGGMTAVYPQSTPGGWHLIGRTATVMFDPAGPDPSLLAPGDRVRFTPADWGPGASPPTLSVPLPTGVTGPAIEVVDAGALLTIQDGGRPGWGHLGVAAGGAADRRSAKLGQRLVGNPGGAAGLESTLGRFRIRVRGPAGDLRVAVTGATADLTVDGLPARPGVALHLRAGMELAVGPVVEGVRVYLAVAGGLAGPVVLGSRSTDTLSGLGPAPLAAGDVVGIGEPPLPTAPAGDVSGIGKPPLPTAPAGDMSGIGGPGRAPRAARPTAAAPGSGGSDQPARPLWISARLGPRHDWLHPSGLDALAEQTFRVGSASDRTAVRLDGPRVELSRSGELPSEGMVAGAIQIPPAGRPIVMMRNHPPTGGYPVVAVVDDAGVDALAQAPPGTPVRLRLLNS